MASDYKITTLYFPAIPGEYKRTTYESFTELNVREIVNEGIALDIKYYIESEQVERTFYILVSTDYLPDGVAIIGATEALVGGVYKVLYLCTSTRS